MPETIPHLSPLDRGHSVHDSPIFMSKWLPAEDDRLGTSQRKDEWPTLDSVEAGRSRREAHMRATDKNTR